MLEILSKAPITTLKLTHMKNSITIFLCVAFTSLSAQQNQDLFKVSPMPMPSDINWPLVSMPELIRLYEEHCSTLVNDTIEQYGIVTWDRVPVRDGSEKIIAYSIANPDTMWRECTCPTFKFSDNYAMTMNSSGLMFFTSRDENGISQRYIESDTEKIKTEAKRPFICQVKLREPEPWSEDFWNWLKNRK